MNKHILSGNEAVALGAFQAGVKVASAYPGTPSTEILQNFATYDGVYAEWAPNEKVALEVAIGSAMTGVRTLFTTKHVGLNVAADPLMTLAYTGIPGGLLMVCADDPGMHSSQNEQDNRFYARFAKIPMLEPSDSQEAKQMVETGLDPAHNRKIDVISAVLKFAQLRFQPGTFAKPVGAEEDGQIENPGYGPGGIFFLK